MSKNSSYKTEPFPRARELVIESVETGKKMNHVLGLIEYDVTIPREKIRKHKEKIGEQLSFTAYITNCVSQAVEEWKVVHGLRKGRRKVIIFDDVNIRLNIEKEVDGRKTVVMYIIRKANEKSFTEINNELRRAQGKDKKSSDTPESKKKKKSNQNLLISLPKFIRRIIWWKLRKDPFFIQKNLGTVGITTLGTMFKKRKGWAITASPHTLSVAIGSIAERPGVINKEIQIREYLGVTFMFNHDVVDGAPAARFLSRLGDLVEEGYDLPDI